MPAGFYIDIEFEDGDLGIFHVKHDGVVNANWGLDIDAEKTDSLLSVIGWTKEDLYTLESKLEVANCISAASGDPTVIGWQRTGLSTFYYSEFNQRLSESQIDQYNDGCGYIFYKDNVVLEYGGGAGGRQCFAGGSISAPTSWHNFFVAIPKSGLPI